MGHSQSAIPPKLLGVIIATTLLCALLLLIYPETDSTIRWQHCEIPLLPPESARVEATDRANGQKNIDQNMVSRDCWVGVSRSRIFAVACASWPLNPKERVALRSQAIAVVLKNMRIKPGEEETFDLWFDDEAEGKLLLSLLPPPRIHW